MKQQTFFINVILLMALLVSVNVFVQVNAQNPIELKVTRVVWGTDPNSPLKAYPGDTEVSLTIEAQNFSPNETIKGITAVLMLQDTAFTNVYGERNVTATGEPLVGDILEPTDEVLPRGLFILTFSLNIASSALPGTYSRNMIVYYSVNRTGIYVEESNIVTVSFFLSKIASTMTCTASPTNIEQGENINILGSIEPIESNLTIILTFTRPNSSTFSRTVKTTVDGSYRDTYQPDLEGIWSVNASWVGNQKLDSDWTAVSFEVMLPTSIKIDVNDIILSGDREKTFTITLSNQGETPISSLDVTLQLISSATSPSPLVIRGDDHWYYNYLEPETSLILPLIIYAPKSAISSTYSASLDLTYRDDYGQSQSESFNMGFIVKGWIEISIYEKAFDPRPVNPDSEVAITATILNKGNVPAMFTNITIVPSQILELLSESTTYVGDVEANSPVPFSVVARVKPNIEDGNYPVVVDVSYRDDQHKEHKLTFSQNILIEQTENEQNNQTSESSLLNVILEIKWLLLTLIGASVAILLLYRRNLSIKRTLKPSK